MKKLPIILCGLSLLAGLAFQGVAHADVNDFTVTNFTADETLTNNDRQGQLHIIEHINVNFTDFNHGLLRAIPKTYKNHSLKLHVNQITSDSGAPTEFTTYGSNGNTVLKIGDPSRTVTGQQEYTIDYTLSNVITFYGDHDELYWDVNGDQWQQPFDQVSATIHLPKALQQTRLPVCYTGSFGSTSQDCVVKSGNRTIQIATTKGLDADQTLTYVAGFQKGYFKPATWRDRVADYESSVVKFLVPFVLIGGYGCIQWLRKGRDPKGRGVIIPEYDPPDGIKPISVSAIMDFKLANRDITATIIDLAIKGYIQIIEAKEVKKLLKDKFTYSLRLKKTDSGLDANETTLINALFGDPKPGAEIYISAMSNKLYSTSEKLNKSVIDDLTTSSYFIRNPKKGNKVALAVIAILGTSVFYLGGFMGWAIGSGLLLGCIAAALFIANMGARTAKGVAAKEHLLGLKMYMEVAEKDRLEKLQGPNAAYAPKSQEPAKTVDLFEKLLPYAITLGVERQWAGKFETLYTEPPSWYSGNWTTFNSIYLVNSLNSGIGSSVNSAFTAPSSSGSSGFGGGGFSGGGGGGGGGGGW